MRKNIHRCSSIILMSLLGLIFFFPTLAVATDNTTLKQNSIIIPSDPSLITGQLDNGFRYVLKENNVPENRVSIMLNIQVGSIHETESQRGMAHFLEHMVFNGSTHYQPNELVKFFQRIGMSFGPDANAHTGFDETVYKILLPENGSELIAEGLTVMRDYADGALLLPAEIEREKGVVLSEKLARDSSSFRTAVAEISFMYKGSKLGSRFPIGTEETIQAFSAESVREFYEKWYSPENMVLVVVGDIDPKQLELQIYKAFHSMIPASDEGMKDVLQQVAHDEQRVFYHHEAEAGKTSVSLVSTHSIETEPDSIEKRKRLLAYGLAGRMMRLRINDELTKPNVPYTDAGLSTGEFMGRFGYASIEMETDPGRWKLALQSADRLLRQALTHGFSESELDIAKNTMKSALRSGVLSEKTQKSQYLAAVIIRNINNQRSNMTPTQKEGLYLELLKEMDLDFINQQFRKAWSAGPMLVGVSGNAMVDGRGVSPEAQILTTYTKSLAMPIEKPVDKKVAEFPYLIVPETKTEIIQLQTQQAIDVTSVWYGNHIRLNYKKTDFDKGKIFVNISFGKGRFGVPKDKPGLADVAGAVINGSGFSKVTNEDLNRLLAGNNTSLSFQVKQDRFQLSGVTVPGEEELLFQLAYARFKDSGYREYVREIYLKQMEQYLQKSKHTVDGMYQLEVESFLTGGDYRSGQVPYRDLVAVSLEDVKVWMEHAFAKEAIEINVVGDLDPQKIVDLVTKYFGSFEERLPHTPFAYEEAIEFPEGQGFEISLDSQIDKSLVNVVYPTTDYKDIMVARKLALLAELVDERFRVEIREKLGDAYSPFAFSHPSHLFENYGILSAFVYTSPDKTGLIVDAVKKIARDIVLNGVDEDEMTRIRNPMETKISDLVKTNRYWLHSVLLNSSRNPLKFQWAESLPEAYGLITEQDLHEMAKLYLLNERAATVIIKPVSKEAKE